MSTPHENRKPCPRAQWMITLFWIEFADLPDSWPKAATELDDLLKNNAAEMRHVLQKVPCPTSGCDYCATRQINMPEGEK